MELLAIETTTKFQARDASMLEHWNIENMLMGHILRLYFTIVYQENLFLMIPKDAHISQTPEKQLFVFCLITVLFLYY